MTIGTQKKPLRVGIAGLGTVGLPVAKWLDYGAHGGDRGGAEGLELSAVAAGNQERAEERLQGFKAAVPVLSIEELVTVSDIIVESAPPEMFVKIAETSLKAGLLFVPLSVTSLLDRMDLVDLARETGARIIVPTGAILGLDAIRSAALGVVHSVTMLTRKPPAGLKKAPFVIEQGIDLDGLEQPLMLFRGNAADAAKKFPANVNVAVALGLAGVGPEKTDFEIWADPGVIRNTHTIKVVADTANFEMTIAVQPTPDNPATGMIVPLSVIETLRGLVTPFKVGT